MEVAKPNSTNELDLFGRQLVAWRVWRWLLWHNEPTVAAVARGAGVHWSSARRALDFLMQLGLAGRGGDGYFYGEPATDGRLGELAKSLNLYGKAAARAALYERERGTLVNRKLAAFREWWGGRYGD